MEKARREMTLNVAKEWAENHRGTTIEIDDRQYTLIGVRGSWATLTSTEEERARLVGIRAVCRMWVAQNTPYDGDEATS